MAVTKTQYISASQVGIFLQCPLAYKYIYVDGATRMPPNMYTAFGSAIHKTLELNYTQKVKSRKDLPISDMVLSFSDIFKKEIDGIPPPPRQPDAEKLLLLQGEEMTIKYMNEVSPSIQPMLVEEKFEIELQSVGITIFGYIDLVTEEGDIIDHKTCGVTTAKKRTQKYVDTNFQLTMYSLAYRKMFNKPENSVQIHKLQRPSGKTGIDFEMLSTNRNDLDVLVLVQLMFRMQQLVANDIWYPNLNSCETCDFKENCLKLSFFDE